MTRREFYINIYCVHNNEGLPKKLLKTPGLGITT
jgi:hypothetical protein